MIWQKGTTRHNAGTLCLLQINYMVLNERNGQLMREHKIKSDMKKNEIHIIICRFSIDYCSTCE